MDKNTPAPQNFLDFVPFRRVETDTLDDGRIVLLRPRFASGPLAKWLQPRLKRKFYRIHLDDIGTAIWQAIDGHKTVGQIAESLVEQFGERVAPHYDRCSHFMAELSRNRMIELQPSEPSEEPQR